MSKALEYIQKKTDLFEIHPCTFADLLSNVCTLFDEMAQDLQKLETSDINHTVRLDKMIVDNQKLIAVICENSLGTTESIGELLHGEPPKAGITHITINGRSIIINETDTLVQIATKIASTGTRADVVHDCVIIDEQVVFTRGDADA